MMAFKWSRVIALLIVILALQGDQTPQLKHINIPFKQTLACKIEFAIYLCSTP